MSCHSTNIMNLLLEIYILFYLFFVLSYRKYENTDISSDRRYSVEHYGVSNEKNETCNFAFFLRHDRFDFGRWMRLTDCISQVSVENVCTVLGSERLLEKKRPRPEMYNILIYTLGDSKKSIGVWKLAESNRKIISVRSSKRLDSS